MKFLLLFVGLCCFKFFAFAQEVAMLAKDETGKYIYYEVVNNIRIPEDSLKTRMLDFFTKNKKEIKLKSNIEANEIIANGKIIINKSLAITSRPSGEITYVFYFEVKDQKYRFWLTDFQFIPYQRDRYGNFVPSTTVGIPLEKEQKKSNLSQWNDYCLQASKYASDYAKRLKDHLANKVILPSQSPEKKVVSKTW